MEPLESTSIHLIQSAIARLLQLMPGKRIAEADVVEYNRQTDREWLAVRDFLVLHYHANGRDEPFWRGCREMAIPDSLRRRMELFRANGRLFRESDELFAEVGWLQVLLGQGIDPTGHDPLADALKPDELNDFLTLARRHAAQVAGRMPAHHDFIAAHCAAAPRDMVAA